jgi:hypothetical protein
MSSNTTKGKAVSRQNLNGPLTVLLHGLAPVPCGWADHFRHGTSDVTYRDAAEHLDAACAELLASTSYPARDLGPDLVEQPQERLNKRFAAAPTPMTRRSPHNLHQDHAEAILYTTSADVARMRPDAVTSRRRGSGVAARRPPLPVRSRMVQPTNPPPREGVAAPEL